MENLSLRVHRLGYVGDDTAGWQCWARPVGGHRYEPSPEPWRSIRSCRRRPRGRRLAPRPIAADFCRAIWLLLPSACSGAHKKTLLTAERRAFRRAARGPSDKSHLSLDILQNHSHAFFYADCARSSWSNSSQPVPRTAWIVSCGWRACAWGYASNTQQSRQRPLRHIA